MRYGILKDGSFHPQPNFYTCILRLEFYQVRRFKDYRFFLILIFFLLAGRRLFSDETHCRFGLLFQKYALWVFERCQFLPAAKFFHVYFTLRILSSWKV